jgi:hypothetical protein
LGERTNENCGHFVAYYFLKYFQASFELLNMVNVLLSLNASMRFTIREVLRHTWFDDRQLMLEISTMQKEATINHQNIQKENIIQVIAPPQVVKSPPHVDNVEKKRKLPFSVPQFLEKRFKA